MCRVPGVAPSGYYDWLKELLSKRPAGLPALEPARIHVFAPPEQRSEERDLRRHGRTSVNTGADVAHVRRVSSISLGETS